MAYELTASQIRFLCSAEGAEWLAKAESLPLTPASHLGDLQTLRRNLSPEIASAVAEQVLLRRKARQKFERADQMLFLRDALEQATHREVARHRARRFAGLSRVADLGCGIGSDSLRLAEVAGRVWSFDLHPARLAFAQHNACVYNLGRQITFIHADILRPPAAPARFDAFFADPARRSAEGKRTFDPHQYHPPLDKLMATYAPHPAGIKIGPGIDFLALPPTAEVEVISLGGEVKEAMVWLNWPNPTGVSRRATLLPAAVELTNLMPDDCTVGLLADYLYEPDGAIIRAGLVKQAGAALKLCLIDEHIAYLSGETALASPLVRGYKIEARLPLQAKAINSYLKIAQINLVEVKQRGSGLAPETFARQLKPVPQGRPRTLILLRRQDEHLALICEKLKPTAEKE